jgi:hypothetical protein
MKQGDILKYALIAVAIYLGYKYLSQSGLFSGFGEQPALPPAQPVAETKQIAAPASQKASVTTQSLLAFVKPTRPPDWDGKATISEWNWYVSKMTNTIQQTDLSFGESVPDPVTVDDYLARRVKAGISGVDSNRLDFSGLAALLPSSNWSM